MTITPVHAAMCCLFWNILSAKLVDGPPPFLGAQRQQDRSIIIVARGERPVEWQWDIWYAYSFGSIPCFLGGMRGNTLIGLSQSTIAALSRLRKALAAVVEQNKGDDSCWKLGSPRPRAVATSMGAGAAVCVPSHYVPVSSVLGTMVLDGLSTMSREPAIRVGDLPFLSPYSASCAKQQ